MVAMVLHRTVLILHFSGPPSVLLPLSSAQHSRLLPIGALVQACVRATLRVCLLTHRACLGPAQFSLSTVIANGL